MELRQVFLTRNPCYRDNLAQADQRYATFQKRGPKGLMLHSVGCAQPSAEVFVTGWNRADYDRACVHAFVDANTGAVLQTLPWNYRGWHCGGAANDTHLGVELCESGAIRYETGSRFTVLNEKTARADCARTYWAAVELFAELCRRYALDPLTAICSHREAAVAGTASDHGDPEHYWTGLGTGWTMDSFRADVAAALRAAEQPPVSEGEQLPVLGAPPDPGTPSPPSDFSDVSPTDWFADALHWAVETGVVHAGGRFQPEAPCTRAYAVVLLRRLWNRLFPSAEQS